METTRDVEGGFASKVFELVGRWTPEQRAEVFYNLEGRWCWDCGETYEASDHETCGTAGPLTAEIRRLRSELETQASTNAKLGVMLERRDAALREMRKLATVWDERAARHRRQSFPYDGGGPEEAARAYEMAAEEVEEALRVLATGGDDGPQ